MNNDWIDRLPDRDIVSLAKFAFGCYLMGIVSGVLLVQFIVWAWQ